MTLPKRHLIDTATFDIGFDNEATAHELQAELNGFINNELMTAVDEVFDAATQASTVLRIARLELDLGAVPYEDWRYELPRRLREKLAEQLAEIRRADVHDNSATRQLLDKRSSRRELLEYFLLHGHLPWYAAPADGETLEQQLRQLLVSEAQAFKQFLQMTPRQTAVIDRLVSQFQPQTVHTLAARLAPAHATALQQLADDFIDSWQRVEALGAMRMLDGAVMARRLWAQLIRVLLNRGSRQLDAEQLFEQALAALLSEQQMNSAALLGRLQTAAAPRAGGRELGAVLTRLAQQSGRPGVVLTAPSTDAEVDPQADDDSGRARLRHYLDQAVSAGEFAPLSGVWSDLLKHNSALVIAALRRHGHRSEIRKRLARGFPEPVLLQILELIEPTEHGFVASAIQRPQWFQYRQADMVPDQAQLKVRLWEFSLGYLLVERGSRFNKKSYLASLLLQMAVANNMDHSELVTGLAGQLNGLAESNASAKQLLQLLLELGQEYDSEPAPSEPDALPEQRAYMVYHELVATLQRSGGTTHGDTAQLIERLEQSAPWLLMRLLREWQADRAGQRFSAAAWSASQLSRLVSSFVRLVGAQEGHSELADAIERWSARSRDRKHYYQQVLNCLLQDGVIDFEAIVAAVPPPSDAEARVPQSVDDTPVAAQPATPRLQDAEQRVHDYLQQDSVLSHNETARLLQAFEQLLHHRPQVLRRILGVAVTAQHTLARVVARLPEHLLSRALVLLGGRDMLRLQQYAELMSTSCYAPAAQIPAQQLAALKWQALFAYLVEAGGLFNEQHFVTFFVDALLQHSGHTERHEFTTIVTQQLVADTLPSTRAMTQRMVAWLSQHETPSVPGDDTPAAPPTTEAQAAEPEEQPLEDIHIWNAGLVLATPYLPRLFDMLGLTGQGAFKDDTAAMRAVHMLQFLVDGNTATAEFQLVLNRLLCGIKGGVPLEREIVLSAAEKAQLEGLLQGMIQNWKALGNTSIAGLRESFLQREGRLQRNDDDAWHLQVAAKPFDMLLDQLPWGYSTIKYPWMERVIYVEWR